MRKLNITIETKMEKYITSKSDSVFSKTKIFITQFVKRVDEILKEYGNAAGAAIRH